MMSTTTAASGGHNETAPPIETDLELLGRTVHAVSSALTEPPRVGDRYMIYDVSFNPRGCVWDASVVVYDDDDDEEEDFDENGEGGGEDGEEKKGIDRSTSSRTSRTGGGSGSSHVRTRTTKKSGGTGGGGTFTFPIRVTCAEDEDDEYEDEDEDDQQRVDGEPDKEGGASSRPRAKTYAVELSIIDDSVHNLRNAADHRDDIKNSVEWISYGIRRSMARSMFPQFPEGCRGRPFREVYQLNKKVRRMKLHHNESSTRSHPGIVNLRFGWPCSFSSIFIHSLMFLFLNIILETRSRVEHSPQSVAASIVLLDDKSL